MMINDSYGPLIHSLPLTLADHVGEAPKRASEATPESEESPGAGKEKATIAPDPEAQIRPSAGKSVKDESEEASNTPSDEEPDMRVREQPDYGFAHPAASRPQRTIWMAKDTLGLSAEELAALKERGIDATNEDAEMDAKGHVTIQGPPPGEESRA
jgi:hypothetical protein